jgi:hypothetical protein
MRNHNSECACEWYSRFLLSDIAIRGADFSLVLVRNLAVHSAQLAGHEEEISCGHRVKPANGEGERQLNEAEENASNEDS